MKDYRIFNDISIKWRVTINHGDVDLASSNLRLEITDRMGGQQDLIFEVKEGAVISKFYGKDQKALGEHMLTLWVYNQDIGQAVLDHVKALNLVQTSADIDTGGTDECDNLETMQLLELEDDIQLGTNGDSAYKSWLNTGHTGTEADFVEWMRKDSLQAANQAWQALDQINETEERINDEEQARVQAEGNREFAEQIRKNAESVRISNEASREQIFNIQINAIADSIDGANLAATQANTAAQLAMQAATYFGDPNKYALKTEIPTKLSQLQNDANLVTQEWVRSQRYVTDATLEPYALRTQIPDISGKADKATTLAGYGITNAYTKQETEQLISEASSTGGSVTSVNGQTGAVSITPENIGAAKTGDLAGKQDSISDLETIRTGAAKGATAVQPGAISDMETKTHASQTYQAKGNYATQDQLNGKANKDEIPDVSGLASQTEVSQLSLLLGDLSNLQTTAKSNIVNAVNEVKGNIAELMVSGGGGGSILGMVNVAEDGFYLIDSEYNIGAMVTAEKTIGFGGEATYTKVSNTQYEY